MFDKFGEMDCKEINELAENLFNEGDIASLKEMAKENGIPVELVDLYTSGEIYALCDVQTAAMGKLDIEAKELKPENIMEDWIEYIRAQCMDSDMMAIQIRKPDKSLRGCIAAILTWSFGHQKTIDKKIMDAAGVKAPRVTLGIPGMGMAKKIITAYYIR